MPLDLEMFLAHTGASLFDYTPFLDSRFSFENNYGNENLITNRSFPKNHVLIPKKTKKIRLLTQKKFISYDLNQKPETCKKTCSRLTDGGKKKKVSFADDKGLSLVEIREIPGTSTCPSDSLPSLVSDVKQQTIQKKWKIAFEYPPWTDNKLIELLEFNKVALESVKIKPKEDYVPEKIKTSECSNKKCAGLKENSSLTFPCDVVEGSIKVKNLCYHKDVFVRITFDRWQSWDDIKANYLKPENIKEKASEWDKYSFHVKIPPSSIKFEVIEFCVFYRCNGTEYWDNNGGVNYRLVSELVKNEALNVQCSENNNIANNRITLSLTEDMEKFSEIDSWNNFLRNQPYW